MSLIDSQPEVMAVDAERAEIEAGRQEYLQWRQQRDDEYMAAVEKHHAAVEQAISAGKAVTSKKPEPPDEAEHVGRVASFRAQDQALLDRRIAVVAEVGPRVTEQAQARYAEIMDLVEEHVAELTDLSAEVQQLQAAVFEASTAQVNLDRADPSKGGSYPEPFTGLTPADLVAASLNGTDLLTVRGSRRLGMQPGNLHAMAFSAREPSLPALR
jgi:hypothetical protein